MLSFSWSSSRNLTQNGSCPAELFCGWSKAPSNAPGVVIVFLLVWLLRRFAMLPLPEELAQTKLLYFFANTNPLTLFLP